MRKLFRKFYIKHKKGFTLFEVLVVLVIMAVLAGIAVPTYNKIIRKSRVSDGLHVLDMLAGAQDKYFVDHGVYAQSLTSLNAPFKEYRVQNPNSPFSDIITTNFTYDKVYTQHCIRAKSNIGGNYTLVKNYKTKDKVVCKGPDCADVSDFVEEISEEGYSILCPNEIECNLTQEQCGEEHFFEDTCSCACKEIDYQNCMAVGGIFVQSTCACVHLSSTCAPEGSIYGGYYTGESCNYQGPIPEYGNKPQSLNLIDKAEKKQQDRGIDPGNGGGLTPAPDYVCGMKYTQKICRNHVWTMETDCVYKGDYCREQGKILDPKTCDCITSCDPDNKPMCVAGNYTTCDPCPNDPDVPSIIEEILQGNSGPHCFHCGHIPSGSGEPTCDTQTGQWHCPGAENGTCTEVSASFDPYKDCNGKDLPDANPSIESSNTCGQKTLSNVRCWQEIIGGVPSLDPIYSNTCELKEGNACFTGDTRECTLEDGSQGIEHCIECKWDNNCVPDEPNEDCGDCSDIPQLPEMFVPNSENCRKYDQECVKDTETNECKWQYKVDPVWVHDYGQDQNCITGAIASCEGFDPGRGGNGGRGMVDPYGQGCGGGSDQCPCIESCQQSYGIFGAPSLENNVGYYNCIEHNCGGWCDNCDPGAGGVIPGNNPLPGSFCPPQSCPAGYYWNISVCRCLPYNPNGGGDDPSLYKYCVDCHWSNDCSLCNPNDMLIGVGTQVCTVGSGASQQCGKKTTTKQACDESTGWWDWVWDGTEPCENLVVKPSTPPDTYITTDGCLKREQKWSCTPSGWRAVQTGNWLPNGGTYTGGLHQVYHSYNCSSSQNIGLNGQQLPSGTWCEGCFKRQCPSGSVRNDHDKKCYIPVNDQFVLALNDVSRSESTCTTAYPFPDSKFLACRKNSDGNAIPENPGCPQPTGDPNHFSCLIDEGRTVTSGYNCSYTPTQYCKTSTSPKQIRTCSVVNQSYTYESQKKWCGFAYYKYCAPKVIETSGSSIRTCDEISPITLYN